MLVAFALRVYALSAQSLWNDEGTSVALSSLSLQAITNGAARDIHPPLYYYLLHFWMPLVGNPSAGSGEYAVRFLSVIAGVLTVAVTFRIAYEFFDKELAIIAAYLAAFSPFQVYYSQEARMYIWVTLFAAVSVWAMGMMLKRVNRQDSQIANTGVALRAARNSRTRRSLFWLLYIGATIAMLYTQYFGAALIVAENLAFAVWWWIAWRDQQRVLAGNAKPSPNVQTEIASSRSLGSADAPLRTRFAMTGGILHSVALWFAAQALVGLATLPWYLSVREQIAGWPSISEPLDLPTLLWRVLNVFSIGITLDAGTAAGVAIAFGVLFFIGWRRACAANADWMIATLILWTLVPVGVMFGVSLARPAYNPKFLLLATPAFFILTARGMTRFKIQNFRFQPLRYVSRLAFVVFSILLFGGAMLSLQNNYANPIDARDDYRAILHVIDADTRAGDAILVDAPGQIDVVRYYRRGDQPLFLLPRMRPPIVAATQDDVDAMLAQAKRLFAIYYATEQADPQRIIETRLAEKAFKASDAWHGNVRLAIYGVAPSVRGAPQMFGVPVGDAITLASVQLDQHDARAGDVLTLTLNWFATQTPSARYKVFVHLLDAHNRVVAQRDGEPVSDTRLTTTWRAGETIADNYGILIEPGTPPGDYPIEIGMYRAEDGARLPIGDSDHVIVGTVRITQ